MTAWLAAQWAKISAWLAVAGAVIVALAVLVWAAFRKGERAGLADAAQQAVKDAKAAQAVTVDAAKAAEHVRHDAAKRPVPDTVKRDDLDTTF